MAIAGIVATTATSTKQEALFIILLCGVIGWFFAVMTRRAIGITPWRIPAILWGLFSAALPPFGLIIELVARFTTRQPQAGDVSPPLLGPSAHENRMTAAYPVNPAGGTEPWPAVLPTRPGPGGWQPAPAGAPWTSTPPLFGWYEDPVAKHEERYWDGREWSDHVRDGGVVSTDPLPPYGTPPAVSAEQAPLTDGPESAL